MACCSSGRTRIDRSGHFLACPQHLTKVGNTLIQAPMFSDSLVDTCNCACQPPSMVYLCNDRRLGPQIFPWQFPLLSFVSNYERFGQKTPKQFLAEYWDPTKKDKNGIVVGGWMYGGENDDGFLRIPDPKNGVNATKLFASPMTLPVGLKVDRFGSEYGTFIAAADAPFAQRSLPPDALNTCKDATKCTPDEQAHPQAYHIYTVIKELPVCGGPAAPWFEQPGLVSIY